LRWREDLGGEFRSERQVRFLLDGPGGSSYNRGDVLQGVAKPMLSSNQ